MSQPVVKWGKAKRYFERRGYQVRSSHGRGGEKIIVAPDDGVQRPRQQVRIGHTSCSHDGTPMLKCYISLFKRVFGVSVQDILDD